MRAPALASWKDTQQPQFNLVITIGRHVEELSFPTDHKTVGVGCEELWGGECCCRRAPAAVFLEGSARVILSAHPEALQPCIHRLLFWDDKKVIVVDFSFIYSLNKFSAFF